MKRVFEFASAGKSDNRVDKIDWSAISTNRLLISYVLKDLAMNLLNESVNSGIAQMLKWLSLVYGFYWKISNPISNYPKKDLIGFYRL